MRCFVRVVRGGVTPCPGAVVSCAGLVSHGWVLFGAGDTGHGDALLSIGMIVLSNVEARQDAAWQCIGRA